jgi:hypothetical protein
MTDGLLGTKDGFAKVAVAEQRTHGQESLVVHCVDMLKCVVDTAHTVGGGQAKQVCILPIQDTAARKSVWQTNSHTPQRMADRTLCNCGLRVAH